MRETKVNIKTCSSSDGERKKRAGKEYGMNKMICNFKWAYSKGLTNTRTFEPRQEKRLRRKKIEYLAEEQVQRSWDRRLASEWWVAGAERTESMQGETQKVKRMRLPFFFLWVRWDIIRGCWAKNWPDLAYVLNVHEEKLYQGIEDQ